MALYDSIILPPAAASPTSTPTAPLQVVEPSAIPGGQGSGAGGVGDGGHEDGAPSVVGV